MGLHFFLRFAEDVFPSQAFSVSLLANSSGINGSLSTVESNGFFPLLGSH